MRGLAGWADDEDLSDVYEELTSHTVMLPKSFKYPIPYDAGPPDARKVTFIDNVWARVRAERDICLR